MGFTWSPWLGVAMFLQMVLVLGIVISVIWGIVYVIRRSTRQHSNEDRAIMILRERYARGEIDDQEFEQMKGVLTKKRR